MKCLKFVCPVTGIEVDTGFELDGRSFADLPREITALYCPNCNKPHILAGVSAWLGELNVRSPDAADCPSAGIKVRPTFGVCDRSPLSW